MNNVVFFFFYHGITFMYFKNYTFTPNILNSNPLNLIWINSWVETTTFSAIWVICPKKLETRKCNKFLFWQDLVVEKWGKIVKYSQSMEKLCSSSHIHGRPYHEFNKWTSLWIWEKETSFSCSRTPKNYS